MTAINFPDTPEIGDTFSVGQITWEWTGSVWKGFTDTSANVTVSTTPPDDTGSIWFNSENGFTYIYYDSYWTSIASSSGSQIISDTAPTSPVVGMQWFNSSTGKSYLYYSNAWIEVDSNGNSASSSGNSVINGAFDIWQRGTSFSNPTGGQYTADRIRANFFGTGSPTTSTYSRQTFTPGAAPLAGVESEFFIRSAITTKGSNTKAGIAYGVESVRTFAGQTATFSFYAKTDSARQGTVQVQQSFGSGGSSLVTVLDTTFNLTSSWQRFSFTVSMPSISGKTIGTGDAVLLAVGHDTADGSSIDVWGLQLEAGAVATPFRRNAPSVQAELAACQRYYYRQSAGDQSNNVGISLGVGTGSSGPSIRRMNITLPVSMRVRPTVSISGTHFILDAALANIGLTAIAGNWSSKDRLSLDINSSSASTVHRPYMWIIDTNSANDFIEASSEL
jgi:hypothetical protein